MHAIDKPVRLQLTQEEFGLLQIALEIAKCKFLANCAILAAGDGYHQLREQFAKQAQDSKLLQAKLYEQQLGGR